MLPLEPQNDNQRWLKTKALDIAADIAQTRWLLIEQSTSSIQWPFLIILMFWLGSMFLSFGLFAPRHAVVVAVFFVIRPCRSPRRSSSSSKWTSPSAA